MSFSVLLFFQNLDRCISKCSKSWEGQIHLFLRFGRRHSLYWWEMTFGNPSVYLTLKAMFMHNFIKIFKRFQEIGLVSMFFRIEPRQRLGQSQMTFDNLFCYILLISMCMQSFITIVHSVRPFSLIKNLELGTASSDVKCHLQSPGLDLAIPLSRFRQQ